MLNFKVKLASNLQFSPQISQGTHAAWPPLARIYYYCTVNSHSYNKKLHNYKNTVYYYTGLYEVSRSSRKYTGGQSRDQSVFENGAM